MRKEGEQRREHLLDKAKQLQDRANKHKAKVSRNSVGGLTLTVTISPAARLSKFMITAAVPRCQESNLNLASSSA